MELLLLYLFIAIVVSFTCSILEAVMLSVTPAFINIKRGEEKKFAIELQKLKEDIDKSLAAILTLNTIAHTVGAAGVGAQAQTIWGNEYLTIVSALLTFAILFFSEIIPKVIGAVYWQKIAFIVPPVLKFLIFILYPVVWISMWLTKLIKGKKQNLFTRTDFSAMAEIGFQEGVFRKDESKIIQNLIKFNKVRVKDIMTPRTVVVAANEEKSILEFHKDRPNPKFARIPVFSGEINNITGYVLKDNIHIEIISGDKQKKLKELRREISTVYEKLSMPDLFELMKNNKLQIAAVIDEHGTMQGIVTMEDILETLIGFEIIDELDSAADLQQLARRSWNERAKRLGIITEED